MKREPGERQPALQQTDPDREGVDQESLRGRVARPTRREEAGPPPPPCTTARGDDVIARLRGQLRSRDALCQAMLLQAILGRPKGL